MAVHDLGYRGWFGPRSPGWARATVITFTGVRRAWQSRWLRRMLLFAWLPALWFGFGIFVWEQAILYPQWREALVPFLGGVPRTSPLFDMLRGLVQDPDKARHTVWAWLMQMFFRYPQGVIMVMVVGLIAPPLISQDIRSRAFLLYFSRPLTRLEYILGKLTTVWIYLALISALPALALYVLGVFVSPHLDVVQATWDLPLRILAASAALMIPTATLALCLSSLTQESRYAAFAWFAIWILGWFTYGLMTSAEAIRSEGPYGRMVAANTTAEPGASGGEIAWWSYLSLYHTLGRLQSWIFGFGEFRDVRTSAVILIAITIASVAILYRRVAAPMRV